MRANDQLLRNHSTQYASFPDFPADRLCRDNSGVYESYVDLEPGVWTKMKLVIRGRQAGSSPGVSGILALMPRHRFTVAILTNVEDLPDRGDFAASIAKIVLDLGNTVKN